MSFTKKIGKNFTENFEYENIVKKLLDHAKSSARVALKTTSKGVIQKTAEAASDLIRNKITNKITKNSPQNNSESDSPTE